MTSLQRHTPRVTDFLSLTSSTVARIRADPGRGQLKPWSAERGLLMGSRPRGTAAGVHLRGRRRLSGTSRSPWTQLPTSVSEPMAIGALDRLGGGDGEELPSDRTGRTVRLWSGMAFDRFARHRARSASGRSSAACPAQTADSRHAGSHLRSITMADAFDWELERVESALADRPPLACALAGRDARSRAHQAPVQERFAVNLVERRDHQIGASVAQELRIVDPGDAEGSHSSGLGGCDP